MKTLCMIKIAIIDDDFELLSHFSAYFSDNPEIKLVKIATTVGNFFATNIPSDAIDILFLDISLPEETGLEALPRIKEKYPHTDVIIFTIHEEFEALIDAFSKGASGYLLKKTSIPDLYAYIQIIIKGGSAISASMAQKLIKHFDNPAKIGDITTTLNEKEYQVLKLLSEGWSYKLIATKAELTIDGVRYYIKRIYRALDVNSKGEAIHAFYQQENKAN